MDIPDTNEKFWQGKLIRLRPMRKNDVGLWLEEDSDSEGNRFLNSGMPLPKSLKSAEDFGERYSEFNNSEERIMFTIETLSGETVGGINIHSMNKKNGTFQTGTRIYRQFRGKRYAEEAKRIVLRYAFNEQRYQKYNIYTLETNEAMIRHAKRIGCKEEGRIRRNIYTNGRFYDELLFGITREEFEQNEADHL
ncbi:MAG: GNAT family protein [Candidatus Hatepunaea meridiana]|nr:GNAT family protein [Candidatus Hatepunaea meridiana]